MRDSSVAFTPLDSLCDVFHRVARLPLCRGSRSKVLTQITASCPQPPPIGNSGREFADDGSFLQVHVVVVDHRLDACWVSPHQATSVEDGVLMQRQGHLRRHSFVCIPVHPYSSMVVKVQPRRARSVLSATRGSGSSPRSSPGRRGPHRPPGRVDRRCAREPPPAPR